MREVAQHTCNRPEAYHVVDGAVIRMAEAPVPSVQRRDPAGDEGMFDVGEAAVERIELPARESPRCDDSTPRLGDADGRASKDHRVTTRGTAECRDADETHRGLRDVKRIVKHESSPTPEMEVDLADAVSIDDGAVDTADAARRDGSNVKKVGLARREVRRGPRVEKELSVRRGRESMGKRGDGSDGVGRGVGRRARVLCPVDGRFVGIR